MNINRKVESTPKDVWRDVGDNDRVLDTADGYHANVYRRSDGWRARITGLNPSELIDLPAYYPTDSEAKQAAMQTVAELRERHTQRAAKA